MAGLRSGAGPPSFSTAASASMAIRRMPLPEIAVLDRSEVPRLGRPEEVWWREAARLFHELPRLCIGGGRLRRQIVSQFSNTSGNSARSAL